MSITFDHVFKNWLENELEPSDQRDILALAKSKGFGSITEWRLATALRLGLDKMEWKLETIEDPNQTLPQIIIGPYQGWSKFFDNQINTNFEQALEIPEFFEWCKTHNRISRIATDFPRPTTLILLKTSNGQLIHIEGGHRICAVAYANKIGTPVELKNGDVQAFTAPTTDTEIEGLKEFLKRGTNK